MLGYHYGTWTAALGARAASAATASATASPRPELPHPFQRADLLSTRASRQGYLRAQAALATIRPVSEQVAAAVALPKTTRHSRKN